MTALSVTILAVWLLVSALSQLNLRVLKPLKGRDHFSLIPRWSFFAPRPGTFDYHLLYRDCGEGGEFGRWREVAHSGPRTLWAAAWNPQKRNRKALSDAVRSLVRLSTEGSLKAVSFTIPYLAILNYVSSLPRPEAPARTQFMIVRTDGFLSEGEPRRVFLSDIHLL